MSPFLLVMFIIELLLVVLFIQRVGCCGPHWLVVKVSLEAGQHSPSGVLVAAGV